METFATTRMSSKGQVVIPEDVRGRLKLMPGVRFVVVGEGDVVILKTITPPSMEGFDSLIRRCRQQARVSGMKRSNIVRAVSKVRSRK
ncbi:MAG: AbrB/MazE/SpoVT family DNA-binding domain-containing protein [Verrucomicrobia bacterium]|nr:AbrB/MazE/SpoVT family DNA-binding domain-containing protein [Verrucomicrobiota bacterium]MBU1857136.1 AbrB/MazE/SpoVT family DNA-binding domain-containing protein [Verrucomicrobiota bacterium]